MRPFPLMFSDSYAPPRRPEVDRLLVESARAQIERNHGQTLERLEERGGLSPRELVAALRGVPFHEVSQMAEAAAITELRRREARLAQNITDQALGACT